jgi:hypothetical protein
MAVPHPQPIWLRAQLLGRPLALPLEWPACAAARTTSGMQALALAQVGPGAFVHAGALEDWAASNGRRRGSGLQASTPTSKGAVAFSQ